VKLGRGPGRGLAPAHGYICITYDQLPMRAVKPFIYMPCVTMWSALVIHIHVTIVDARVSHGYTMV
jgi:hypothetical protein